MSRETSWGRATVKQLCETFRVSRAAFYAVRPLPQTPPPPRPRRATPGPWASAADLDAAIRHLAAAQPGWGGRKIWASLKRQGVCASRRRVAARLRALGLTLPAPRERQPEVRQGHVAVPASNRRLATDLTTVWTAEDGLVALVPVIDCGDRVLHEIAVTKSQDASAVLDPVVQTLRRCFGAPEAVPADLEIRTDHGPQYTGRDAEALCARWHLTHTFAPVGRPTGNAVAERVIQTVKVELLWTRDWRNAAELRDALAAWLEIYNHHRPHQALGWRTPAEQRALNLAASREAAA